MAYLGAVTIKGLWPAPQEDHPSHKTRFSDSSFYDEICTLCGATDAAGDDRLKHQCQGRK